MFKDTKTFSSYSIDDVQKTKEFYGQVLGLSVEETPQGLKMVLMGGGTIFMYPKKDHVPATFTVLNFVVDNIDKAVNTLKEKGIVLEQYNNMTDEDGIVRGISKNMGPDIAWFKDPAGNFLSVLQEA